MHYGARCLSYVCTWRSSQVSQKATVARGHCGASMRIVGDCGGTFLLTVQVIQSHVFIGSVDDMFCLIQHLTQLYVVHVPSLSKELM